MIKKNIINKNKSSFLLMLIGLGELLPLNVSSSWLVHQLPQIHGYDYSMRGWAIALCIAFSLSNVIGQAVLHTGPNV